MREIKPKRKIQTTSSNSICVFQIKKNWSKKKKCWILQPLIQQLLLLLLLLFLVIDNDSMTFDQKKKIFFFRFHIIYSCHNNLEFAIFNRSKYVYRVFFSLLVIGLSWCVWCVLCKSLAILFVALRQTDVCVCVLVKNWTKLKLSETFRFLFVISKIWFHHPFSWVIFFVLFCFVLALVFPVLSFVLS